MPNTREALGRLNCAELKRELAKRGARTSGRKHELLERLEAYEKNHNFSHVVPLPSEETVFADWPKDGFRQLTEDNIVHIPDITNSHIDGYLTIRVGIDNRGVGDAQAVKKGKLLHDSNRVQACSFVEANGAHFYSGICKAAMKKSLSYSLKVRLGLQGEVINSHCECPAGQGPHGTCKHVAAMLYALVVIKETGSLGTINAGCTDRLQTFNQPSKKYTGSPIKAEDLPGSKGLSLEDPRPVDLRKREGRMSNLRKHMINYCSNSGKDLVIRYMFDGGNLQDAAKDHDYLKRPLTEQLVYNRNEVTAERAMIIERKTRTQALSDLWFDERQWRLTASRFGEVCSLTDRRNMAKFCESLMENRTFSTPAMAHGRMYEKVAIEKFQKDFGVQVMESGLVINPSLSYLAASPDGFVGQDAIVEVKCPYTGRDAKIAPGKNFAFLECNSSGVLVLKESHKYYKQVQGQLHLTGRKRCFFVVYTFVDFLVFEVPYEKDYCIGSLIPKLDLFYKKWFVKYIASTL